jgi:hypothetical protein
LRERTRKLRSDVESLNRAITAELDWRDKLHPVEIDGWDDEEAV